MIVFAYLLPLAAALILKTALDYGGDWKTYLWLVAGGEAFVAGLHYLFHYQQTSVREYLGSLVSRLHYEEPWTELVPQTVTRRDSRGNTYTTVRMRHVYHPERYYFDTSRGSTINTDGSFFRYVADRWGVVPTRVYWRNANIRGGIRYGLDAAAPAIADGEAIDDVRWVGVTESHRYSNRIRNSNSIFKYRHISRKEAQALGLYDYPAIQGHEAPAVLSRDVNIDFRIRQKFNRFNGALAPLRQMRLYILVFRAESGVGMAELQRAYWQGGNKNEFVVCLGMTPEGRVEWATAFSWADSQELETATADWFMRNPQVDWDEFHSWFARESAGWKRKEFSDFKYIGVNLRLWQVLTLYGLTAAVLTGALILIIKHS